MKIFLAGTSFRPEYGGPAVSVARLAVALAAEGVDVAVWSPDGSQRHSRVFAHTGVVELEGSLDSVVASLQDVNVIHDNGIWLPHNHRIATLAHRRRIPRLVSTRGMLEPWAMRHKPWKKRIAWQAYQRRDLRIAAALHAATSIEADRLSALDLNVPIAVVPNGVDIPAAIGRATRPDGKRVALFLGRIYPVKGLPMLIEAWSRVRPPGWILRIAGPDEAGHLAEVKAAIEALDLSDVVELVGPANAEGKRELFAQADLFVLPTHTESFGMAIAEALANGLPVLTTTGAPWPSLEATRSGWRVKPAVDDITAGLEVATRLSSDALAAMGQRGRAIVARDYQWSQVAEKMKSLYERLRD